MVGSIRFDAFPDGGLSRVRALGLVDPSARRTSGYRWFNALPASQAIQCLTDAGVEAEVATEVVERRPLLDGWFTERALTETSLPSRLSRTDDAQVVLRMLAGPYGIAS